ncbi:hypothetical protein SUGI_0104930 [Cryptomeria japonica]|nr:hypothetical protein SUGI_0104930 [Cryptomeria japonica]
MGSSIIHACHHYRNVELFVDILSQTADLHRKLLFGHVRSVKKEATGISNRSSKALVTQVPNLKIISCRKYRVWEDLQFFSKN